MNLNHWPRNEPGIVIGFVGGDAELETRLREIGFAEGDTITKLYRGPLGGNPIAVKLNGTFIALRREEASAIDVTNTLTQEILGACSDELLVAE